MNPNIQNPGFWLAMALGFGLGFFLLLIPGPLAKGAGVLFFVIGGIAVVANLLFDDTPAAPEPSDTFGAARWADEARDRDKLKELLSSTEGVFFGFMRSSGPRWLVLHYSGPRHLVTVAPNRTGKGTCAIVPNLLSLTHSVVVIDPKGENAAITARYRATINRVRLLNPFNEHGLGSARFNPLAHLSIDNPNLVADVSGLAEALIVADGKDTHWSDSARSLVRVLLLHLVAEKGGAATLIDMRRLLTQDAERFGSTIFDMMHSPHGFISQPAAQFEGESREIQSIISTARTQTAFLDDPAIARVLSGSDFNMLDLKAEPTTVYIVLPSRFLVAYARFFRLLVVSAIDQLQSRPGGVRTTLFLDEFAALGHLSAVETAFGQAAGFNVQLWPFLQDLNQLRSIYKDRWESFIANAGVVQWFTPNDQFTADYLSKRLGQKTVFTRSMSQSTREGGSGEQTGASSSESLGETGVPLCAPVELMGMDSSEAILTLSGLSHGIRAARIPYYFARSPLSIPDASPEANAAMRRYLDLYSGQYDANPFHG